MTEVLFRGISGRLHRFAAHRPDACFAAAPAVYAFARPGPAGRGWTPLFLSRTANLAKRLAAHEQWPEAQLLGATHILVSEHDERDAREYVEADLAQALRPIMNGPLIEPEPIESAAALKLVWAA